ncbi:hypothetical protein [Peribacillus frigoritolerans]|uniref:hypothetical protein n=1 Tax=Peribacillus frigoritolerans TaxID=450367 RepID=UPI0039A0DC8E
MNSNHFVYVCQSCQELFEDFTSSCDLCGKSDIEKVHKGDMGMDEETRTDTNDHLYMTTEKLFKRYDMQDENDFEIETLLQMKDWLVDFWNNNPDDDMTDEEHEEMIEEIMESDEHELFERLAGIDYTYDELDENS